MSVDFVVGEVGFGSNLDAEAVFYRAECEKHELRIKDLETEVAEKQREINALRRTLQKCAALAPDISDEKHEVLLRTAPKKH